MDTTSTQIENYSNEINAIAIHAKSIGFDIVNGDIMDLMKSWLKMGVRLGKAIEDNKYDVIQLMHWFVK